MRCAFVFMAIIALWQPLGAVNYWVSPDGDDSNDGLDSTTAWATVDNGDILGVLAPGDTVNVLPGFYENERDLNLTTSGTGISPIVYRKYGAGDAVLISDNYYPAWRAKIDGSKADILLADGNFIGIPVTPGKHNIEVYFDSRYYNLSSTISESTWIIYLIVGMFLALLNITRRMRNNKAINA